MATHLENSDIGQVKECGNFSSVKSEKIETVEASIRRPIRRKSDTSFTLLHRFRVGCRL